MVYKFIPIPNTEYSVLLKNGHILKITFTIENDIYEEETFLDYHAYECYDDDDTRYIFYMAVCECDSDKEYCVLKTKNMDGEITTYHIDKLYLNNHVLYQTKSFGTGQE